MKSILSFTLLIICSLAQAQVGCIFELYYCQNDEVSFLIGQDLCQKELLVAQTDKKTKELLTFSRSYEKPRQGRKAIKKGFKATHQDQDLLVLIEKKQMHIASGGKIYSFSQCEGL